MRNYRDSVRFKNYYTDSGTFPLELQLLQYGERMLGKIETKEPLLVFLMKILPQEDRVATLRFMRRLPVSKIKPKAAQLPALRQSIDEMDVDDFVRAIRHCLERCKNKQGDAALETFLKSRIIQVCKALPRHERWTCYERMTDLMRIFSLSEDDVSLLAVSLCYSISDDFESICDATHVQRKRELIGILTGMPLSKLATIAGRKGRLVSTGILDAPELWGNRSFYKIAQGIRDHLIGMGDSSLLHKYAMATEPAHYTPDSFGLSDESVRITLGLLNATKPCNLLLHGVPGTGKTEYAKAVATACGKQAVFVTHATEADHRNGRVAVEAVTTAHLPEKYVVVVDEADEFLNLRPSIFDFSGGQAKNGLAGKSWLNDFLDRSKAQIIWITNDIDSIDESSMRRFSYNIPFRRQSARRRGEIWREHLRESPLQPLVSAGDVADMARKFRVGAAGIASALANAAQITPAGTADKETVLGTLRELLASHERLTRGGTEEKLVGLASQYDPGAVCTDVPAEGIVTGLKSCASRHKAERPSANLLFWGPPGTGKTAFAQYLAQSLDKELLIRRASDLLSMYVGGTEHNIREAFEQASHEEAILLLDEADSFFIDRTRAHRSWETSQTNELLTQMENHHGILICCTNLLDSLDHAVLRRFAWKVRFQAPTAEGRQRIYRRYFDVPENPAPADSLDRVARIEHLTPGDMKAVWVRFRFRPAAEWSHQEIVQALSDEVTYRGQKNVVTGFHAV